MNRLQQVLLSTTYAIITPILSLSSSSHPDEEEEVKAHTHTLIKLYKIISVVVVYEKGVGLKSSITVDTNSRKDLTLQGCTNCPSHPSLSVATHHRQPFYDLVPRDPKRQVPLANNEQIRVAPGESTPNPKAGHALGPDSSVSTGFGLPVSSLMRPGPRRSKVDQQGNHVSAGPGCFKRYLLGATRQDIYACFQMVNQLGPPLEMFEAR